MLKLIQTRLLRDISLSEVDRILGPRRSVFQRFIWGMLLCAAVCITIWQIEARFKQYMSHPTLAEIQTKRSSELPLPAVTICSYYSPKYYRPQFSSSVQKQIFQKIASKSLNETSNTSFPVGTINWSVFLRELWPCPSVKRCVFIKSAQKSQVKSCSQADFVYNPQIEAGQSSLFMSCVTLKRSNFFMRRDGFFLFEIPIVVNNKQPIYIIRLHQSEESPQLYEQPIKLYASQQEPTKVIIFVTASHTTHLPRNCELSSSNRLAYFQNYSVGNCISECYFKYALKVPKCNCFIPSGYPVIDNSKICPPDKWSFCHQRMEDFNEESCDCPPLCHQDFYFGTKEESIIQHSAEEHKAHFENNATHIYKVFIKYTTMTVQHTLERRAFTTLQLLAELGGILSLFIGLRLLTVLEICDVIVFSIYDYVVRRGQNQVTDSTHRIHRNSLRNSIRTMQLRRLGVLPLSNGLPRNDTSITVDIAEIEPCMTLSNKVENSSLLLNRRQSSKV